MSARRVSSVLLMTLLLLAAFLAGRYTVTGRRFATASTGNGNTQGAPARAEPARPTTEPVNTGNETAERRPSTAGNSAPAILARLKSLTVSSRDPGSVRRLLLELETLRNLGPAAVPVIRDFLATAQDADFDSPLSRSGFREGRVPADFVVPPSLRLALLEVAKNIGGPEATALLEHELKTTGRGVEAAYLAAALQQIAPGQFVETAAAAARELLAMPLGSGAKNALDRADREYLYGILAAVGDRSQIAPAQAQLVLPTGGIDRGALQYLQQTLGEGALAIVARAWDDPRIAVGQRQPLAALALTYVGASAQADQLWERAINDPQMPPDARKDLIEDLNQQGFANPRQLTPAHLPLIQRRLALIEQHAPKAIDAINAAAFAEARKDLLEMRERVLRAAPPKK